MLLNTKKFNILVFRINIRNFSDTGNKMKFPSPVLNDTYLFYYLDTIKNKQIRNTLLNNYLPYCTFNSNFGNIKYKGKTIFYFENRLDFYCFFRFLGAMDKAIEYSDNQLKSNIEILDKVKFNEGDRKLIKFLDPLEKERIKKCPEYRFSHSTIYNEYIYFYSKYYPDFEDHLMRLTYIPRKTGDSYIECLHDKFTKSDIKEIIDYCQTSKIVIWLLFGQHLINNTLDESYYKLKLATESITSTENFIKLSTPKNVQEHLIRRHIKYFLESVLERTWFRGNLPTYFFYYDLRPLRTSIGSKEFNNFRGRKNMVIELSYYFPYREDLEDFIECIDSFSDNFVLYNVDLDNCAMDKNNKFRELFPILYSYHNTADYILYLGIMKQYLKPFIKALENILPNLPSINDDIK